jgi:hypothetical protein
MTDEQEQDSGEVGRAVAAIMAARPTFVVGDRVRVLVGECNLQGDWAHGGQGDTGTVGMVFWETFKARTSDGHEVHVWVPQDAEGRVQSGWYAPTELEKIDP